MTKPEIDADQYGDDEFPAEVTDQLRSRLTGPVS